MNLVVDANIVIAALIRSGHTRQRLMLSSHSLFSPMYLIEEIENNSEEISEKIGISVIELAELVQQLLVLGEIHIINASDYDEEMARAIEISPDIGDAPYFALALKLNCAIWSNDKRLKNQSLIKVYSTKELL